MPLWIGAPIVIFISALFGLSHVSMIGALVWFLLFYLTEQEEEIKKLKEKVETLENKEPKWSP